MADRQTPGITRTDLQQHDLSAPGREVIQHVVEISPKAPPIWHKHPGGEEIIYVLEGSLEYDVDGRSPTTVEAGEVFFVPADTVHAVRNVGPGNAAELATYVVEKGTPFVVPTEPFHGHEEMQMSEADSTDGAPTAEQRTWGDVLVESYLAE
jgi:quercetin dioxygenase-like cupin family protein